MGVNMIKKLTLKRKRNEWTKCFGRNVTQKRNRRRKGKRHNRQGMFCFELLNGWAGLLSKEEMVGAMAGVPMTADGEGLGGEGWDRASATTLSLQVRWTN